MSKKKSYLGIITKADESGMEAFELPAGGGMLFIHEDEDKEVGPLALVKLSLKHMDFVCFCRKPSCTRRIRFNAVYTGSHPTPEKS